MKILFIASRAGSLIGFRKALIESFLAKNLEVHATAPDLKEDTKVGKELSNMGVIIHDTHIARTGLNPLNDIKSYFYLHKLMQKIKPDIVLPYTIKPVVYGTLAAWITRVPHRFALVTGLGYAFQNHSNIKYKLVNKVATQLYKTSLNKCQTVFFQNPDDEALFRQLNILKPSTHSFVVNGSGVNISEYAVTPLPSQPRFLLIARLLGDKGVREYAQAAKQITKEYPLVTFDLVGRFDNNPDAIKQSELEVWINEGTVNYLGELTDVRPAITNSSVYVLPSYREGTPRTVLEAMSMGRAIITTDAPGCRETVIDGDNGFLVPVKSVDALAKAMKKLIEEPERIQTMGQRSREIAEAKYDVHKVNAAMLEEMGI